MHVCNLLNKSLTITPISVVVRNCSNKLRACMVLSYAYMVVACFISDHRG